MQEIIEELFGAQGGKFLTGPSFIREKLLKIKAFVFDWDGVFNSGEKTSARGSSFSEVDSMGVNLLRFSHFLRTGAPPVTLIISGEKNESAFHYSERENFKYSFYKIAHKLKALEHLCQLENLQPHEVCYFFDDVLDVPIAERCGIRILVNQRHNPMFLDYCKRRKLADYLTGAQGGNFAVREGCELLISLGGSYDDVIGARVQYSDTYQNYLSERRKTQPVFYTLSEGGITLSDPRDR